MAQVGAFAALLAALVPLGASTSLLFTFSNGSFGGNSLVETIGLADAKSVVRLTVTWPTTKTSQTFRDVAADQAIEVTEGSDSFKVLHQPRLPSPPAAVQSATTDAPGAR